MDILDQLEENPDSAQKNRSEHSSLRKSKSMHHTISDGLKEMSNYVEGNDPQSSLSKNSNKLQKLHSLDMEIKSSKKS